MVAQPCDYTENTQLKEVNFYGSVWIIIQVFKVKYSIIDTSTE